MQVILKKDISTLGRIGEVVKVRPGYARNYLLPRSLAVAADPGNVKGLEHQKQLVELHKKKVQKESEAFAETLKDVTVKIKKTVNEAGKMFGSITASDVLKELKKANWEQVITHRGVVNEKEYKIFKKNGKPNSWSGDVGGGKVVLLTEEEYAEVKKDKEKNYYIRIEWRTKLSEYTDFDKTIKNLEALHKYKNVLDVRIVFWFDN